MTGMMVSWTFATGGSSSASWTDLTGGFHGVAIGTGYLRVSSTATTFTANWQLLNGAGQGISSIRLNGAPGRTLFDCGLNTDVTPTGCDNTGNGNGAFGTAGSADGWSLRTVGGGSYTGAVSAQYANLVGLGAAAPVGDLFEQVTINFDGSVGAGQSYTFRADTDNSSFDAPPPNVVVPEPSTYALLSMGLAAIIIARRKRQV